MGFQKGNTFGRLTVGKHPKNISDAHRKSISLALKGKMPKNLEQINANKFGENNPMFGIPYTPEMREKRSKGMISYWDNHPERKVEIGIKFSGENNPNYGRDMSEEKNPHWYGDDVGYSGVHSWVEKWKGQTKMCEMCGTTEAKKYEWANIDHKYRRVLEDYIRLCTSCHRKYDYENNK